MSSETGYLRFPTLCGNAIVFVSDDDLWRVDAKGGVARRLTAGVAETSWPALSPDGRRLAFVGREEQHPEVYVMSADGGPARRLTWLGPDVIVRGWTPESHVLFVSTWGQPFFRNYQAFSVDPAGGQPVALSLGQVNHLGYGPDGCKVIGRNTADPARWKRYRGGTAGHLWVDAQGSGVFGRLALAGNVTSPMWIGDRIWFLSDAEGVGNLYSCAPDGSRLSRHTDHDDFYARHAQTDGKRIVYQCGAQVWLYDPVDDTARALDIRLPSHRTQAARRFVAPRDYLQGFAVHPKGHSLAVTARGKLFSFALWEGAVREHGDGAGGRSRHGQWLGDGSTLAAVSDSGGEERVVVSSADGMRTLPWDVGRVVAMRASPKGSKVAIGNHRNEVLVGDVETGEIRTIDRSDADRTEDLAWSPDGAWLAYTSWTSARQCAVKLHSLDSGETIFATRPEFRDYAPAFDPEGHYLYFMSLRTFDPVYDALQFELSFPRGARPYLISLRAGQPAPFDPRPRGLGEEADTKEAAEEAKRLHVVQVDAEGLSDRIAAFPVPENRFGRIVGVAGEKVLWSVLPVAGAHGRGGHEQGPARIERFDFATLRTETLVERADDFALSTDAVTLAYREGGRVRAIPAHRPIGDVKANASEGPSRSSGWIDVDRIRVSVDPPAEWRQMFREVWRLQRDQFWVENMSGVDWEAAYRQYEPLLARIATRSELSDLIWELQGELGTSHAYEMGGDYRKPPQVALGYLAADLQLDAGMGGYVITRIVRGDTWDPGADSPLNAPGAEVRVGERIVAVNGQPVTRERSPQSLLVHQSKTRVELRLASGTGSDERVRTVTVTTLADEVPARYREWVERNRAWVHQRSGGRVGYLHLPDMMSAGFAEFHRYFRVECDLDALIVDVRYNRGGHVSQLLLEKVARKRIGYNLSRWNAPASYPDEAAAGPVVALTNEHAGSDGDIFSHGFKLMKLGPLVGTRTWGGVIGIWPRHALVDGTETSQPEFSFWFPDVEWGVENYGTDPTIEVDNAPQDGREGRDRQLEVALAVAQEAIAKEGTARPAFDKRPNLARAKLPPRRR